MKNWLADVVIARLAPGLALFLAFPNAGFGETDLPRDAVRVEFIEGLPDQTSWNFTNNLRAPHQHYSESAFGFVVAPTKYSARGVKLDRALPFLLRATGRVA